jgi:hypothetical protein
VDMADILNDVLDGGILGDCDSRQLFLDEAEDRTLGMAVIRIPGGELMILRGC